MHKEEHYFNQTMNLYAHNYQKMARLLHAQRQEGDLWVWDWDKMGAFKIVILKQFRYTEELSAHFQAQTKERWLTNFYALIRLYHDMHLAEVIAFQDNQGKIQHFSDTGIHPKQMSSEKWQMNHLLFEALSCCTWLK